MARVSPSHAIPAVHPPRRGLGLVTKLGAAICIIMLFAASLSTLLNYFNFQKSYSEVVRTRYAIVAQEIGSTIEYGLGVGLGFAAMESVPRILAQTRADHPNVQTIALFDTAGRVVVDADADRVGQSVASNWRAAAFTDAARAEWSLTDGAQTVIGLRLKNGYGEVEGALALVVGTAEFEQPVHAAMGSVLWESLAIVAVLVALTMLLVQRVLRGLVRASQVMGASLDAVLDGKPASFDAAAAGRPIEHLFVEVQAEVAEVLATGAGTDGRPGR